MQSVKHQILKLSFCCAVFLSCEGGSVLGAGLGIHSPMNVHFLVIDPMSRKTGYDGYLGQEFTEIPFSSYDVQSIGGLDTSEVGLLEREFWIYPSAGPLVEGQYLVKVFALTSGPFWLEAHVGRDPDNVYLETGDTLFSGETRLYRFTYSNNPSVPIVLDTVVRTNETKGGIFLPSGGPTISVKAKSTVAFTNADTLIHGVATLRWPSGRNITLGTVSSPVYGFSTSDTVSTLGEYAYQKFCTTQRTALAWQAGVEYDLFTVPIENQVGIEEIELTNALPGGEWFVDVNYLERSDSVFYQPTAYGFVYQNKSASEDATATNSARHLAKWESYLHEVFASGGEVVYRRSDDEGSSWDQTHLINTSFGDNARPCMTVTQHGHVQIVWQRRIAPSTYQVWHSSSTNDGVSWSTPTALAGAVQTSQYQTDGTTPVIAELIESGQLVVVYCSEEGLLYQLSDDDGQNWESPASVGDQYDDRVRHPSLAGSESYISLVYDYANNAEGPWSRVFNGSTWSEEEDVGKGTGIDDAEYSSVAIDGNGDPIAVWTGISTNMTYGKVITFHAGYADNTWSEWFTMFGQNYVDRLSPSLTYYNGEEGYGIAIANHTSQNHINLAILTSVDPPSWDVSTINESGAWANITQETASSGLPIYCWTDQSAFPYEIVVGSTSSRVSTHARLATNEGAGQKRLAVIHHRTLRSALALEFDPMKIVLANGDTTVVPFKTSSLRQRGKINYVTMWDYLGSGIVNVPANARQLIVSKRFGERGVLGERKFSLRVLNNRGISIAVLDTTSTNGTITVNIAPYAGMNVSFSPALSILGIEPSMLDVGVGDVFIKSR